MAQMVKNLPAMQETWVRFLGWEDPLEKEMGWGGEAATDSSTFAWRVHGQRNLEQSMGSQRIRRDSATNFLYYVSIVPFLALSLIFYKFSVTLFPFFVLVVYCLQIEK